MDSEKLAIPVALLVAVLAVFVAIAVLVMSKGGRTTQEPEQFANSVLSQNRKVFERLADM
ncbi:MAG TPA: hypothetical protein VNE86_02120 [Nitrososphaerales archaeon]|nr:hypothetical protein [Nitrososphaerales archaeon]